VRARNVGENLLKLKARFAAIGRAAVDVPAVNVPVSFGSSESLKLTSTTGFVTPPVATTAGVSCEN